MLADLNDAGPIVFLSPNVILEQLGHSLGINDMAGHGVPTVPPRFRMAVRIASTRYAASRPTVVITNDWRFGEVRARLARLGVRVKYHPDWPASLLDLNTTSGIVDWLARRGSLPRIVVGRLAPRREAA